MQACDKGNLCPRAVTVLGWGRVQGLNDSGKRGCQEGVEQKRTENERFTLKLSSLLIPVFPYWYYRGL